MTAAPGALGAAPAPLTAPTRPYIDVHAHVGDTINRVPPCGQTAEKYLARMADTHVVAAILCPAAGGPLARGVLDTRDQNEAIAAACREYPDRFPLGLTVLEIRQQQAGLDEIARAMDEAGLAGFMCHPGISGHSLGAEIAPALEVVDARGGLVLLHAMGGTSEARIAAHARQFRRTTFIAAHVSMRAEQHRASIEALAGLENVWADFAQHPVSAGDSWGIDDLVRGFGPHRLTFGSDIPYYDYRLLQAQIEAAPIDESAKDAIAWRNAVDLIRRFRPQWELPNRPVELSEQFAGVDLWTGKGGRLS